MDLFINTCKSCGAKTDPCCTQRRKLQISNTCMLFAVAKERSHDYCVIVSHEAINKQLFIKDLMVDKITRHLEVSKTRAIDAVFYQILEVRSG